LVNIEQRLTPHFTLGEMIQSSTAVRLGIKNIPGNEEIEALKLVCEEILEPVRMNYGIPFSPSSGYRSVALNSAVGSRPNSQHCLGQAADFEVPGISNVDVFEFVSKNLCFDQLILEYHRIGNPNSGWIHASVAGVRTFVVSDSNRSERLVYDGLSYSEY